MYLALALFLATYVLLLIFGKYRAYIAAASALLFVVLGILPDRKSTRLNSSHIEESRMPSSA